MAGPGRPGPGKASPGRPGLARAGHFFARVGTSNDLDDSEFSLFIEENQNVLKYNRKDKN